LPIEERLLQECGRTFNVVGAEAARSVRGFWKAMGIKLVSYAFGPVWKIITETVE